MAASLAGGAIHQPARSSATRARSAAPIDEPPHSALAVFYALRDTPAIGHRRSERMLWC